MYASTIKNNYANLENMHASTIENSIYVIKHLYKIIHHHANMIEKHICKFRKQKVKREGWREGHNKFYRKEGK